jgi:enoyl-[acyl-carrier protein] reductase III
MFNMTGRVALVTGGSRGIGKAIAIRLAEHGMDIVVNYVRHKQDAQKTAAEVEQRGQRCLLVKANVAKEADVSTMFEAISEAFGSLDVLVSNAASGVLKPVLELTERHWNWAMDINARALLSLVQHGMPLMKRGSRVIAVSSLGSIRAIEN